MLHQDEPCAACGYVEQARCNAGAEMKEHAKLLHGNASLPGDAPERNQSRLRLPSFTGFLPSLQFLKLPFGHPKNSC